MNYQLTQRAWSAKRSFENLIEFAFCNVSDTLLTTLQILASLIYEELLEGHALF